MLKQSFRIAQQTAFMNVNSVKAATKITSFAPMQIASQVNSTSLFNTQMRQFSAALPDHFALEMPNLSPTMEKVSSTNKSVSNFYFISG